MVSETETPAKSAETRLKTYDLADENKNSLCKDDEWVSNISLETRIWVVVSCLFKWSTMETEKNTQPYYHGDWEKHSAISQ